MAKFYGMIGFIKTVNGEDAQRGIWKADTIERPYKGDVIRNTRRWQDNSDRLNDDLTINNQISIVADSFATENLYCMKYVSYLGTRWNINDVTVEYPRLILTLGGVYNGQPLQSST